MRAENLLTKLFALSFSLGYEISVVILPVQTNNLVRRNYQYESR
jgi:hypothetical protein